MTTTMNKTIKKTQSGKLTPSEINELQMFNERLQKVEHHLLDEAKRVEAALKLRVDDSNDPMNDYEIDAKVYYTMREGDPKYDEDDDNFLSERFYMLKNLRPDSFLCDGSDWREPCVMTELAHFPHCRLFHELYDHTYGKEGKKLSLRNCLRVGSIWVVVSVEHQSDLDIDSGKWLTTEDYEAMRLAKE